MNYDWLLLVLKVAPFLLAAEKNKDSKDSFHVDF